MASSQYLHCFPDYDDSLDWLPAGMIDISWGNDACPFFAFPSDPLGEDLRAGIDYADPMLREIPNSPRYFIHGAGTDYASDNREEFLARLLSILNWRNPETVGQA